MHSLLDDMDIETKCVKELRNKYTAIPKQGVSIVVPTAKKKYISNIFRNYSRCFYPNKELIIVLNSNELKIEDYKKWADGFDDIKVFKLDERYTLGECLNFAISNSRYDYIARMDDDDYYSQYYLMDLMNVFNYTDADMTGKNPIFVYFEESHLLCLMKHRNAVLGATFLFKKHVFDKVKFRALNFMEDHYFLKDCENAGIKIYPSDKYNYAYMRHNNQLDHTFRISSNDLIKYYELDELLIIKDFPQIITI